MSLTLNMTPAADNQAIFLLKLSSEGSNLIANSTFANSTGWTLNGDWAISSGTLNYVYSSDSNGTATYSIAAVEATEYVLEYEVTNTTGVVVLKLAGGSSVTSDDVTLDSSIGKHVVTFAGNAGETVVILDCTTLGGSVYLDNVKIRKADNSITIATRAITLDATDYTSDVLQINSLSDIDSGSAAESGGGYGQITGFTFGITRFSTNSKVDNFFNEFFPAYNGGIVYGRQVQIGLVWNNATTLAEITWLMRGRFTNYDVNQRNIILTVLQESNLDARELPYYSVQKDFDNGVSYFEDAPEESYGASIPILYGDFTATYGIVEHVREDLFPLVCADKIKQTYLAASHKLNTSYLIDSNNSKIYVYQDAVESYMFTTCANSSAINSNSICSITEFSTLDSEYNVIWGTMILQPSIPGSVNEVTDFKNIIDDDATNSNTVTAQLLSLKTEGSGTLDGQIGTMDYTVDLLCLISNATPDATNQIAMGYFNKQYDNGTGGYSAGLDFTWTTGDTVIRCPLTGDSSARDKSGPWDWDELLGMEWTLGANLTNELTVKYLYLRVQNIVITDIRKRPTRKFNGRSPEIVRLRELGRG